MKRDIDLIRKILFEVEEFEDPWGLSSDLEIDGYDNQVVSYHVKLLFEAGLLEADDVCEMGSDGYRWWAKSLTWEGHEFLDAARDDSRWNKAKRLVAEKAGGLMFEALKFALTQGIKSQLLPGT